MYITINRTKNYPKKTKVKNTRNNSIIWGFDFAAPFVYMFTSGGVNDLGTQSSKS